MTIIGDGYSTPASPRPSEIEKELEATRKLLQILRIQEAFASKDPEVILALSLEDKVVFGTLLQQAVSEHGGYPEELQDTLASWNHNNALGLARDESIPSNTRIAQCLRLALSTGDRNGRGDRDMTLGEARTFAAGMVAAGLSIPEEERNRYYLEQFQQSTDGIYACSARFQLTTSGMLHAPITLQFTYLLDQPPYPPGVGLRIRPQTCAGSESRSNRTIPF